MISLIDIEPKDNFVMVSDNKIDVNAKAARQTKLYKGAHMWCGEVLANG